jgi:hypothetical protein
MACASTNTLKVEPAWKPLVPPTGRLTLVCPGPTPNG